MYSVPLMGKASLFVVLTAHLCIESHFKYGVIGWFPAQLYGTLVHCAANKALSGLFRHSVFPSFGNYLFYFLFFIPVYCTFC